MAAATALTVSIAFAWPPVSSAWMRVLGAVATPLAGQGGAIFGPAQASTVMPAVLAVIVAAPMAVRRRAVYACTALAATFVLEVLSVVVGSWLGMPKLTTVVLGPAAQFAVPLAVLVAALAEKPGRLTP